MSESSPKSSNQSNADSNKSNTESNTKSSKDSQTQKEQMVLEVVRKWEYSPNNENFAYWATISEFTLKKDDEIVKDSQGKDIKGYIIEPAGANPNVKKSAIEQQQTAGGDIRIPAGEYEVFWKKSEINKPALMIENPNNKEPYLKDLQSTIQKSLGVNISILVCNATCKHNREDRKRFGTKHIHIVPQLKQKGTSNATLPKDRGGIIIHYGDTGQWSDGCLLPTNELKWKQQKEIAQDENSTINAVARLCNVFIQHDLESFKNYKLGASNPQKSSIKNLTIKITEFQPLQPYPPKRD